MILNFQKIKNLALMLVLTLISISAVNAQTASASANPRPVSTPRSTPKPPPKKGDFERSIAVEPNVNVGICVTEGNVKINGWDRSEVRVFVKNGSVVGFNTLQSNRQSGKPVWISLITAPAELKSSQAGECISGSEVEIDVPRTASVVFKGEATKTTIDSIRKATVKTVGGDIYIRNIAEGVDARTYEGDVSVENSSGAMYLDSANGSIIAFDVSPSDIGDIFKAKNNSGSIVLSGLEYRQTEVYSISGAVAFNGEFLTGGLYNFGTSNGSIALTIPQTSSCKIVATYGFGGFTSEMPFTVITENKTPRTQKIVGTMGNGDATLNLTTSSGVIRLKKSLIKEENKK